MDTKKIISFIILVALLIGAALGAKKFISNRLKKSVQQQQVSQPNKNNQSKYYPDTIPEMMAKDYSGSDFKLVKVLAKNNYYTHWAITYKSEGLTISGVMNIPNGKGPFPVVVLNHGYFDPKIYISGNVLRREQDFFARNGYVTLLSDYRNYGNSDFDPNNEVRPRAGYVEDVINAIGAIKDANLSFLDTNNIFMLGHSMGGGVTLNIMVIRPDIANAYVLLAPINADYKKNFDRWVASQWPDTAQQFYSIYGTYDENPSAWESLSAKNYFDKVDRPVMIHQGTADSEVPVQWSRDLANDLKKAEKDVTYYEYPGQEHVFTSAQDLAMRRTLNFFNTKLNR